MHLSIEKRTTVFIITLTLFSAVVLLFVIWPTINHIKELRQQTSDLRLVLEKKYERSYRLHASLSSIRELSTETKMYSSYILKRNDELRLITLLEELASREHVTQIVQNSNLDASDNQFLEFSLSITGSYTQTLKYLASLEKSFPYFVILKQVQLTQSADRSHPLDPSNKVTLSTNVRFYAE